MLLIGGAAVGGYLLLKPRSASAATLADPALNGLPVGAASGPTLASRSGAGHYGDARAALGARAVAQNGTAGVTSLINGALASANAKNAQGAGQIANKYLPGSGQFVQQGAEALGKVGILAVGKVGTKAGGAVISGIKKLKFW